MKPEWSVYWFVGFIFLLAVGTWLHAKSIDPPLENEDYLAENPELRQLKQQQEASDDDSE